MKWVLILDQPEFVRILPFFSYIFSLAGNIHLVCGIPDLVCIFIPHILMFVKIVPKFMIFFVDQIILFFSFFLFSLSTGSYNRRKSSPSRRKHPLDQIPEVSC